MSEDAVAEIAEGQVAENEAESTPADPVHELAQQLGWNPDFEGDGAVDAKTFILRSKDINRGMSRTIGALKREMTALKEGIETVKMTAEQSSKREIGRLKGEIAKLKTERRKAITDGDADAVDRFDAEIGELEEATREAPAAPATPPGPRPEYVEWVKGNQWYVTDPDMQAYANELIELPEYKAVGKVSYERLLKKVEKAVKQEFSENFQDKDPASAAVAITPAAPVTPSRQRAKPPKSKATAADLSYEQRQVGTDFVRQGLFKTIDEYAQALQDSTAARKGA